MAKKAIIYSRYNPPQDNIKICEGETLTEQAHNHNSATSVTKVIERYKKTGIIEGGIKTPLDINVLPNVSFQEIAQIMATAQQSFESLPATVREAFGHDPSMFMSAIEDERQHGKLRDLGILPPLEETPEQKAAAQQPTTTPSAEPPKDQPIP